MSAVEQDAVDQIHQTRVIGREFSRAQLFLDVGIFRREELVELHGLKVLVYPFLTGLAVPQIDIEAQLAVGEVRQIGRMIHLYVCDIVRVGFNRGSGHKCSGEIGGIDLFAGTNDAIGLGAGKDIADGGKRRINAGLVAAQIDAVVAEAQRHGRRIGSLIDLVHFDEGVVFVHAARHSDLQRIGAGRKFLKVCGIDRVCVNVKCRSGARDIGQGIPAVAAGAGHAVLQVGVDQIELIIEIPDVHIGNIGLIGIHAQGRGLGAVEAAAQYGYG